MNTEATISTFKKQLGLWHSAGKHDNANAAANVFDALEISHTICQLVFRGEHGNEEVLEVYNRLVARTEDTKDLR